MNTYSVFAICMILLFETGADQSPGDSRLGWRWPHQPFHGWERAMPSGWYGHPLNRRISDHRIHHRPYHQGNAVLNQPTSLGSGYFLPIRTTPFSINNPIANTISIEQQFVLYFQTFDLIFVFLCTCCLAFSGATQAFGRQTCRQTCLLRLYWLIQFLICSFPSPKHSAISRRVFPAVRIAIISGSIAFIFVHFLLLIATPTNRSMR